MNFVDLKMSRAVKAKPGDVYDVWLDATSPGGPWFRCERVILNAAVDGLFYHCVRHEGRVWAHYGRFIRLERPMARSTKRVTHSSSIKTTLWRLVRGRAPMSLAGPSSPLGSRAEQGSSARVLQTLFCPPPDEGPTARPDTLQLIAGQANRYLHIGPFIVRVQRALSVHGDSLVGLIDRPSAIIRGEIQRRRAKFLGC
jgi:hypothetical protein